MEVNKTTYIENTTQITGTSIKFGYSLGKFQSLKIFYYIIFSLF